jgi:hypothetical protein
MAENDDVQLVESISGIDGMSPTLDVQSVHICMVILVLVLLLLP